MTVSNLVGTKCPMQLKHPGKRLRRFREDLGLTLRSAARQLHVQHPALKAWEEGETPMAAYRRAIQVWTQGAIRHDEWPLSIREREVTAAAARVRRAKPNAAA